MNNDELIRKFLNDEISSKELIENMDGLKSEYEAYLREKNISDTPLAAEKFLREWDENNLYQTHCV